MESSTRSACRSDPRLMPSSSHSTRSAGSRLPGASSPESISDRRSVDGRAPDLLGVPTAPILSAHPELSGVAAMIAGMEMLGAWVRGWAVSRAAPPPVDEPDGHRVDVGLPGHRVRYLLRSPSTVATRARTVAAPGTWLKTCGARSAVLAGLTAEWEVGKTEYLMTFDGGFPPVEVPAPYSVAVTGDGPVWQVAVTSEECRRRAAGSRWPRALRCSTGSSRSPDTVAAGSAGW